MSETKRVIVYVPEELHKIVALMANEEGRKISNFISQLLKNEACSRGYLQTTSYIKENKIPVNYAPAQVGTYAPIQVEGTTEQTQTVTNDTNESQITKDTNSEKETEETLGKAKDEQPVVDSNSSNTSVNNIEENNKKHINENVFEGVDEFCS